MISRAVVGMIAGVVFAGAVLLGTLTDEPERSTPANPAVLSGDFHVHAAPGDGVLTVWDVQRDAARQGLDVIAITNHNQNVALRLAAGLGLVRRYPIVIPGQELTTSGFHIAAIGIERMIDWRLSAREAIAAIHAQGGVAIAAHPISGSWLDQDPEAIRALDGSEVSHPMILGRASWREELMQFHSAGRSINPDLAPIGSSDFHGGTRVGLCRTYLIVHEVSREGVLEAIRNGRTVAAGPLGQLTGSEEHIRAVRASVTEQRPPGWGYGLSTWIALLALLSLAALVLLDARSYGRTNEGR